MGLYTKLPEGLEEVDVIIAGGERIHLSRPIATLTDKLR